MKITKELIQDDFTFVRTWDITDYTPEGTVDEYEIRNTDCLIRLLYHKHSDTWEIEALSFDCSAREYKCKDTTLNELCGILLLFGLRDLSVKYTFKTIDILKNHD